MTPIHCLDGDGFSTVDLISKLICSGTERSNLIPYLFQWRNCFLCFGIGHLEIVQNLAAIAKIICLDGNTIGKWSEVWMGDPRMSAFKPPLSHSFLSLSPIFVEFQNLFVTLILYTLGPSLAYPTYPMPVLISSLTKAPQLHYF